MTSELKTLKDIEMKDKFILDPTCGGRTIWFNKNHPNVIYGDIRKADKGICPERPNFNVSPDVVLDFRALDFPDKSFKLITWDPPHMKTISSTSIMAKKYGCLGPEWKKDLRKGFKEIWRVLDDYGILIFKWNENEVKLKEILGLFPEDPIVGHTTGSKSLTHWFCFMKIPKELAGVEE